MSETPTPPTSEQNRDLVQKATELANLTKQKGIAILTGKFNSRVVDPKELPLLENGWNSIRAYVVGLELKDPSQIAQILGKLVTPPPAPNNFIPYESYYSDSARQLWVMDRYQPFKIKKEVEIRPGGLFRKREVRIEEEKFSYQGRSGNDTWSLFNYFMPTKHHIDTRPTYLNMTVVVPPEIAAQISQTVRDNPYFPNAYFKALYPNLIGPNHSQAVQRIRATELMILERRQDPSNTQGVIIQYAEPIPY